MKIFDRCRNGRGLCAVALVTALAACAPKPPARILLPPTMGRVSLPSVPNPSYLAAGEFITQPVVGTGFYSDPNLLMSRNLDPHEGATAATVDAFMRICLPLSSGYGQQGPDIDAHVLDPLEPVSPGGGMELLRGQRFCVRPGPDGRTDAVAMAERLAQSPAMISYAGTYVAREPSWCGGVSKRFITATPDDLMVSSVAITSDDSFRGNRHCWVSERTAKYSLVVTALLQALKAAGRDFVPDPAIQDGTLLRQTALVEQRDGITRTILIAAPEDRSANRTARHSRSARPLKFTFSPIDL